jgi:nicotinamidase-related amidase
MVKLCPKNEFLPQSLGTLTALYETVSKLPELKLTDLPPAATALILVDLINGFVRNGLLQSPRVAELIPEVVTLIKACDRLGISKLAFADRHWEVSPEFAIYPVHCLVGTDETEIVDEIKEIGGYRLIAKNSTNGFLEEQFQEWLALNRRRTNFIVAGDCTDICIQQFAITLKAWFNRQNQKVRVIVPLNVVDTFDQGVHNADLMNVFAVYTMISNGVEVVKQLGLPEANHNKKD